jgi:hypothetical protein
MAQVFSAYEARNKLPMKAAGARINSIQLLNDGKRWWVMTVAMASPNLRTTRCRPNI